MSAPLWVFGYGSLVWRPDLPWVERRPGWIAGYARRFWQGSTDHRGVPGAPGRVVTLVPQPSARTWGVAWRVDDAAREAVLAGLDHREQGGYARHALDVHVPGGADVGGALTYVATPSNPNWLGPAPLDEIAATIDRSAGPSGPNDAYLLRLAEALDALGGMDDHVRGLVAALESLRSGR